MYVICNNCWLMMTFMLGHMTFRQEDRRLVSCLLFWQDVTDYGKEEDRSADRLLRLCHAWNIYNLYFPDGSNYPIGRPYILVCVNNQMLLVSIVFSIKMTCTCMYSRLFWMFWSKIFRISLKFFMLLVI